MENQICPLHNVPLIYKEGKFGGYHSHVVPEVGYCNGVKITPFKHPSASTTPAPTITREPVKERDFDAENRGKVRHGIVVALIEHNGSDALKGIATSAPVRTLINQVTEFVMNGEEF